MCRRCSCGDSNPLRDVFTIQRAVAVPTATDLRGAERDESLEYWRNGDVTVMFKEEAGTQMIQHQDSVTDYCSLSSECSLETPSSDSSSIAVSSVDHGGASLGADHQGTAAKPDQKGPSRHEPRQDPAGAEEPPCTQLQAFAVLSVNRTVWVPRYTHTHTRYTHMLHTHTHTLHTHTHTRSTHQQPHTAHFLHANQPTPLWSWS